MVFKTATESNNRQWQRQQSRNWYNINQQSRNWYNISQQSAMGKVKLNSNYKQVLKKTGIKQQSVASTYRETTEKEREIEQASERRRGRIATYRSLDGGHDAEEAARKQRLWSDAEESQRKKGRLFLWCL